jgi:hypothetical protein
MRLPALLLVAAAVACLAGMSARAEPPGHGKFIQTFTVKLRGGEKLAPGDERVFAKFDMVLITRNWHDAIQGGTWAAIHRVDPTTEIYIQSEGPTIWREHDKAETKWLKGIARYENSRGHPMGSINEDHPEFFLLKADGTRCLAYKSNYRDRFLMDFGSPSYQRYWIESVTQDIIRQPWRADGVHIDNMGPLCTFETEKPAKYDTDEKWCKAASRFIDASSKALRARGAKVWINAGGTSSQRGWNALLHLDALANPPDVIGEEGAFCHSWGKGDTTFPCEEKWRRSVDFLGKIEKSRQAFFAHTKLRRDRAGTDNHGKRVTFWQSLWYALGSYLLGKDDDLGNAYFFFFSSGEGGYGSKDWWFEEYDRIDLGKAVGAYRVSSSGRANVYRREFRKGYVYVNPTDRDAVGIKLPRRCRMLTHDTLSKTPGSLPVVSSIDLKAHHAAILLKDGR